LHKFLGGGELRQAFPNNIENKSVVGIGHYG
jgi:hypothetical protein